MWTARVCVPPMLMFISRVNYPEVTCSATQLERPNGNQCSNRSATWWRNSIQFPFKVTLLYNGPTIPYLWDTFMGPNLSMSSKTSTECIYFTKKAIRCINKLYYNAHTEPLFIRNKILKLDSRVNNEGSVTNLMQTSFYGLLWYLRVFEAK